MVALHLRFPGGRYHATPWGHHVNEGLVEWPPSPWRLLRTIIATGYAHFGWSELPDTVRRLIEELTNTLPVYKLPRVNGSHSRHYMPTKAKRMLVIDSWANVPRNEYLEIYWDVVLDAECRSLLMDMAQRISYLGRSESWVIAEARFDDAYPDDVNAFPSEMRDKMGMDWELIPTIAPLPKESYDNWRNEAVRKVLEPFPLPAGKEATQTLLKNREKVCNPYPRDIIECLQMDTAWWKKEKWGDPPGSRKVLYWRKADAIAQSAPSPRRRIVKRKPVQFMLLALNTPTGNLSALPSVKRTLPQAELLHRSLISNAVKMNETMNQDDLSVLNGCDEDGRPLRQGHRHLHILPADLDGDNHIDHFVLYAPAGISGPARQAIRRVERTWTKGGIGDLQLAFAGEGAAENFLKSSTKIGESLRSLLGGESGSRNWVSLTPFVPPRYIKKNGRNSLEGQIQAELESRGFPAAKIIFMRKDEEQMRFFRHFVRLRSRGSAAAPQDVGFGFRLEFDREFHGPLCLGYGSHFGMGMFRSIQR